MGRMQNMFKGSAMGLGCLFQLALGFLYAHAVANGIHAWTGIWLPISYLLGFGLASSPFIGTILAIVSAVKVWDWSVLHSVFIFVLLPLVGLFVWGLIIKIFER